MSISSLFGGLIILCIYQCAAKLLQKTVFLLLPRSRSCFVSMAVNPLPFSVQTHRALHNMNHIRQQCGGADIMA